MPLPRGIVEEIKRIIPPLDGTLHKGQSGRVGVLGGALDYTGAPFFASMAALRFGADLSHVICSPTAAPAIKSYSPDLIVHPILEPKGLGIRRSLPCTQIVIQPFRNADIVKKELSGLLSRLHVIIIGPGLGREPYMQTYASTAMQLARERGMYLVIDADALLLVGQDPSLIRGYPKAVLTPNVVEFKRLCEQVGVAEGYDKNNTDERAAGVSKALGGVTVLQKGGEDIVAVEGSESVHVDVEGGLKRCGGQGDILSGCVGTLLAWGKCYEDGAFGDGKVSSSRVPLLAAVGGSIVTRTTSRRAFYKEGRGVVTHDMLGELGKSFTEVFGEAEQGENKGRL
ncbi:YjeF domain-containing protein [Cylindrobasidium torrendii FP15055 ss-10]|uniref:ATP-dependent (S)-NAD(P)H-hydrate dehydratase n=1 Tax=Cylindrobasidium torrendii FP15055 ss-10 TaxID=1314674 RepID=A0A0D7BN65_9AGAR|nr:YjeF domain-containing protein [Cylindrobasidium torrendii FP15055 ss-10]